MNHLQEAKKGMKMFDANRHNNVGTVWQDAVAHALISIAEQLEIMNNKTPEQKHYDSLSNTCHCPGCGAVVENPGNWCDNCVPF